MKRLLKQWSGVIILTVILVYIVFRFDSFKPALYSYFGQKMVTDSGFSLPSLTRAHLMVVLYSSLFSVILGIGLGVFSLSKAGKELSVILDKLVYLGQMIPSLAILSFIVTFTGFGPEPAIVALIIFGIFPIYVSTVTGLQSVPESYLEVADSIGMTAFQKYRTVILPMALPIIISGLRTALIINISAATLSFYYGGGGLGILLFSSLKSRNYVHILEGTIVLVLLSLIVDRALKNVEDMLSAK